MILEFTVIKTNRVNAHCTITTMGIVLLIFPMSKNCCCQQNILHNFPLKFLFYYRFLNSYQLLDPQTHIYIFLLYGKYSIFVQLCWILDNIIFTGGLGSIAILHKLEQFVVIVMLLQIYFFPSSDSLQQWKCTAASWILFIALERSKPSTTNILTYRLIYRNTRSLQYKICRSRSISP